MEKNIVRNPNHTDFWVKHPRHRGPSRKLTVFSTALASLTALIALILASPLLLNGASHYHGINWQNLGNIGQAYGGISAILSGLALAGIATSLLVQARQARTERIRLVRENHLTLLRMAMDQPGLFAPVLGGAHTPTTSDGYRRFMFLTMYMRYALTGFEMGLISERMLREEIVKGAFSSKPGRDWWNITSKHWHEEDSSSRKEREFKRIIREEAAKALEKPAVMRSIEDPPSAGTRRNAINWSEILAVAIGSITIGVFIGSLRRKAGL